MERKINFYSNTSFWETVFFSLTLLDEWMSAKVGEESFSKLFLWIETIQVRVSVSERKREEITCKTRENLNFFQEKLTWFRVKNLHGNRQRTARTAQLNFSLSFSSSLNLNLNLNVARFYYIESHFPKPHNSQQTLQERNFSSAKLNFLNSTFSLSRQSKLSTCRLERWTKATTRNCVCFAWLLARQLSVRSWKIVNHFTL